MATSESNFPSRYQLVRYKGEPDHWQVKSSGPDGFAEVTRCDYTSAKWAAEVHERATGQSAKIIPKYE